MTQLYMPHNATHNTTGVSIYYQDRMAQKMTELRGTFDAAKVEWNKLFGEPQKSIHDIDVIGLYDKTTGEKHEFVSIDRVVETIDTVAAEQEMWGDDIRALKKAIEEMRQ